jgi:hypothetical protein
MGVQSGGDACAPTFSETMKGGGGIANGIICTPWP